MARVKYLKTAPAAKKAVDEILIREKPVLGVKCLGCNVGGKDGRITLVAFACWDGNVYVFDVCKCPEIMYDGGVLRLLQSAEMLKVFHNCAPDSATLVRQFGVKLQHFYDLEIAHSVIMESEGLSPRRLTFAQMCETYRQPSPTPSPQLRRLLCDDMNTWARRPCTEDMLALAAAYVQPLVPALFSLTDRKLPMGSNDWFTHQCDVNSRSLLPLPVPQRYRIPNKTSLARTLSYCCKCANCRATKDKMTSQSLIPEMTS